MRAKPGRGIHVLFISIIATILCAGAAFGTTIYVDDNAPNDPGPWDTAISDPLEDGTADHPFDSIQQGIDAAVGGHTVLVEDGTYSGAGNRNLDLAGKAITLRSIHGPEQCIIDCQGTARGFLLTKNETTSTILDGLTITRGAADDGAGIYCKNSSPSVVRCILDSNGTTSTNRGGGIYLENSSAQIVGCTLTGNQVGEYGSMGGIYGLNSNPKVRDCTIADNIGGGIRIQQSNSTSQSTLIGCQILRNQGSGVQVYDCGMVLTDCLIQQNMAGSSANPYGGGVLIDGGDMGGDSIRIERCQILDNRGLCGGGILTVNGPYVDIFNTLVSGNTAIEQGGGVYIWNRSVARMINCTVANNHGPLGPGILEEGATSTLSLINTIVWGNGPDWGHPVQGQVTLSYTNPYISSFSAQACDIQGGRAGVVSSDTNWVILWKNGNINSDPLFQNPGLRDYHLTDVSPCVDRGINDPNIVNTLDIDGCPRPLGAGMDMGADEHDFGKSVIHTTTMSMEFIALDTRPDVSSQNITLRNGGSVPLNWKIESIPSWLSAEPAEGQSTGEWDTVQFSAHREGLAYGQYDSTIQIVDSGAVNSPVVIPVVFIVEDGYRHVPSEYPTIQAAIDAAVTGEQVVIAPETYRGPGNRDLDFKGKAITVRSQNPQDKSTVEATEIDCQGSATDQHQGFVFRNGEGLDSIVDGLTIVNGYSHVGGGIQAKESNPTIRRCILRNNESFDSGGAFFFWGFKAPEILECTFENNKAVQSAGGAVSGNPILLRNCVFVNNVAGTEGGAVYSGESVVENCVFEANRCVSGSGGAVSMNGNLSNCLLVGNYARYNGGAMFTESKSTLLRCTLAENRTSSGAGGIYAAKKARITVVDSIVWGNSGQQIIQASGGSTPPVVVFSTIQGGFSGHDIYNLDPVFVNPGFWTDPRTPNDLSDDTWISGNYHLMTDSPCIDAGDPAADFSNEPQPNGGRVDIGAYGNTAGATITTDDDNDGVGTPSEIRWGLNPHKPDTDGDELSDGFEVGYDAHITSYNPYNPLTELGTDLNAAVADTDEDGISDFAELNETHSDPLRFDFTGKTLFVDDDAPNDPGPGSPAISDPAEDGSAEHPFDTLQKAVALAVNEYVISVADGLYRLPTGLNCGKKMLFIRSQNGPANCILDAAGSATGIEFNGVDGTGAVLEGVTVRNAGVGIRSTVSTLVIRDCIVSNNGQGNVASIVLNQGIASVVGCRIVGNRDTAISCSDGQLTLSHCAIQDNGGTKGIFLYFSPTTMDNCLITRNALTGGQAVFCTGMEVQISNCTIADNSIGIAFNGKTAVIRNSILWNSGEEVQSTSGVTVEYCDIDGGLSGTGNINEWPMFLGKNRGDYHLLDGSPCINAGDPQTVVGQDEVDIDGEPRMLYGRVDMGCDEAVIRDLTGDKQVDLSDLGLWVSHWMESGCAEPQWCERTDMTFDGMVGLDDLSVFAERWMVDPSSPLGRWPLNGNMDDMFGQWAGTAVGDPAFVGAEQAKVGTGAVELDGNDAVVMNGFTGITGTKARTCAAWIKTTGVVAPILYWGDKNTAGGLWDLRVGSLGQLRLVAGGGPVVDGVTKVNTGQWVHVAAVLPEGGNSASAVQLYVNGMRETEAVTAGTINTKSGAAFRIGTNETGLYFTGLIDDVRIYDRALPVNELRQTAGFFVAVAGADRKIPCPIGSTNLSVPLEGKIVNGTGTQTASWSVVSGPVGVFFEDVSLLDTQVVFPIPGKYTLRLTVSEGFQVSQDDMVIILSSEEVGYWGMDGDYSDSVNGYPGTPAGDPAFVNASQTKVGTGAVELDGNDSVLMNGFMGITGTKGRTCMAWIKTTGVFGPIVYWGDKNTAGGLWDLRVGSLGQLRLMMGGGPVVDSVTVVNTGQWVHVAAVLPEGGNSASAVQLYVNGVRETEAVTAGAINTKPGAAFRIGTNETGLYFMGLIDDVRIYDRALTAEEIAVVAGN